MSLEVFSRDLVEKIAQELNITTIENATIGEVLLLAVTLEKRTGIPLIRMDQGSPGLDANFIGREAEKQAIDRGVGAHYPPAGGIKELKTATSNFVEAFLNISISPQSCIPTCGSVAASYGAFIASTQRDKQKDTVLFIDPGFPINKSQLKVIGAKWEQFDIYHYRGTALADKIENFLKKGNIAAIVYSNPNNPAWICLEDEELEIIGQLATKYDAIVIEDLAYFCMDDRKDLSHPYQSPYPPSVAHYTDNYILMLSSSKIFSYAGQRAAVACISDQLYERYFPAFAERYSDSGIFGKTFTASIMYMITSGITHSTQYALAEMFNQSIKGNINFVADTHEYALRAQKMKKIFTDNGFYIVYDKDLSDNIGDGFFFTIGYPGFSSGELVKELLCYGVSSISLGTTGSKQEGVRACTSSMHEDLYPILEERMKKFRNDH